MGKSVQTVEDYARRYIGRNPLVNFTRSMGGRLSPKYIEALEKSAHFRMILKVDGVKLYLWSDCAAAVRGGYDPRVTIKSDVEMEAKWASVFGISESERALHLPENRLMPIMLERLIGKPWEPYRKVEPDEERIRLAFMGAHFKLGSADDTGMIKPLKAGWAVVQDWMDTYEIAKDKYLAKHPSVKGP